MAGKKRSSEYAAKCKLCLKPTEHFSGVCKECRANNCKRCGIKFTQKVTGVTMCDSCRKAVVHQAWDMDISATLWLN